MRRFSLLSFLLLIGCHPPVCHTGHYRVDFTPAHTEYDSICVSRDKDFNCTAEIPVPRHVPDRCYRYFVCDMNCDEIDNGKLEAHDKHLVIQSMTIADPHCSDEGAVL